MEVFLSELERSASMRIVFAVEAGSRAWGTDSANSDYDIRFVFVRQRTASSTLPDTVERKDGSFDAHGWSAAKALQLGIAGNGALAEWLRSPIVYRGSENITSWRATFLPRFPKRQLVLHYHSLLCRERKLCIGGRREIEDLKGYLHCVRPALCAEQLLLHPDAFPPMMLADLLAASEMPASAQEFVKELIQRKRQDGKLGSGPHCKVLDDWMDAVESKAKAVPKDWATSGAESVPLVMEHLLCQAVERCFPSRTVRVGILLCAQESNSNGSAPAYGRNYAQCTMDWLSESRMSSEMEGQDVFLSHHTWDVQAGHIPSADEWSKFDLIVATGSPSAAYDDCEWIHKLSRVIADIVLGGNRSTKFLGICFGHQLLAQATGGRVAKNPWGVETGFRPVQLTPAGQSFFRRSEPLSFIFTHQDTVSELPNGASRLASNEAGEQIFCMGNKALGIQGHPEFSAEMGTKSAERRLACGSITPQYAQESIETLKSVSRDDALFLGAFILGRWLFAK